MAKLLVRGLSQSKLQAMGFNTQTHGNLTRIRRGRIVGSFVCNGRFEPGVLNLINTGPSEDDEYRAITDIGKVASCRA